MLTFVTKFLLTFLQINLSLTDAMIWDYTSSPLPSWNNICETDLGFRLPNNSMLLSGKETGRKRRSSLDHYHLHRSERLELFHNIEGLMDL